MKANQTFTILFWLYKSRIHNGLAPVYCRITIDGRRVQFSMKRKVEPENWSTESEKAIGKSEEIRSLNNYLDHVRVELQKHYNILLSKGEHITAETIRNSYMGIGEETKTLFESFTYHNENMEARIGIDITKATLTKYETVKSKLKLFVKKRYNKSDQPLESLNHQFITEFEYFLKIDQRIGYNTTMKYIRNLNILYSRRLKLRTLNCMSVKSIKKNTRIILA